MLKLSKRVEYALLAVQEMARQPETVVSAKDVAARFNISFTLVAKVLQQLGHAGYVRSSKGVRGGYVLAVAPQQISIADVIEAVEGRQAIVDCQEETEHDCSVQHCCTIRGPLAILQERITTTFSSMSVAELVGNRHVVQVKLNQPTLTT